MGKRVFCPAIGLFLCKTLPACDAAQSRALLEKTGESRLCMSGSLPLQEEVPSARQEALKSAEKMAGQQRSNKHWHTRAEPQHGAPQNIGVTGGAGEGYGGQLHSFVTVSYSSSSFDVSQTNHRLGDTTGIQKTASRHQRRQEMQKKNIKKKHLQQPDVCGSVFLQNESGKNTCNFFAKRNMRNTTNMQTKTT